MMALVQGGLPRGPPRAFPDNTGMGPLTWAFPLVGEPPPKPARTSYDISLHLLPPRTQLSVLPGLATGLLGLSAK